MDDYKLYGVTGKPVLFSKSPMIFNEIFSQGDNEKFYTRIAAESAEEALFLFKKLEFSGMNITAPFKKDIIQFLDIISDEANIIDAVNSVYVTDNGIKGENTDHLGVSETLNANRINVRDSKVVVLGAGGAARAAVFSLVRKAGNVTIINRTKEKARKIAEKYGCSYAGLDKLKTILNESALLISTLPGNVNIIPKEWLSTHLVVFDANYKNSSLIDNAREVGCKIIRGEEWLLHQAVPSYQAFMKKNPDIEKMKAGLIKDPFTGKSAIISLIGTMGVGKSTVGKLLSAELGWGFVDLDEKIEQNFGKTIPDIFKNYGELTFRKLEADILKSLSGRKNIVLACGGGIVLDAENRKFLKENTLSFWLFTSPDIAAMRIDNNSRPLLKTDNYVRRASNIFNERKKYYVMTADVVVNSETNSAETVSKILKREMNIC